jgi:hypothetical protein
MGRQTTCREGAQQPCSPEERYRRARYRIALALAVMNGDWRGMNVITAPVED